MALDSLVIAMFLGIDTEVTYLVCSAWEATGE